MGTSLGKRKVICADAAQFISGAESFESVVTSLPDAEETSMDVPTWEKWYVAQVAAITRKTRDYVVFYQTDRKKGGRIRSKAYLTMKGIIAGGGSVCWHKVVLRKGVDKVDLHRPTYTHLIAGTCNDKLGSGKATPDVFERGKMIYKNAMGLEAAIRAVSFVRDNAPNTATITDPFCGRGTILAVANKLGLNVVGVDILPEQVEEARKLWFK